MSQLHVNQKPRVLVVGGTGFVGGSIAKHLIKQNYSVRILTRNQNQQQTLPCEYIQGDMFDEASLLNAMKNCDVVVQAAQFKNAPFENKKKGLTYEKIDFEGTCKVIQAAVQMNIAKFIYISGAGTAEGKAEPWFRAKWKAETYLKNSSLAWIIFRPSWIYGSLDRSMNPLIEMVKKLPVIGYFKGSYKIQPVDINDVSTIVAASIERVDAIHTIFEVGGPEKLSMKEIIQIIARVQKKKRWVVGIPNQVGAFLFLCIEFFSGGRVSRKAFDFITMDGCIEESRFHACWNFFSITPSRFQDYLIHQNQVNQL